MSSLEEVLSGAMYERPGSLGLVQGRGEYVADLHVEGCLEAAFTRSWAAHGTLTEVDVTESREVEGVTGAFAARDLPDLPMVPLPPLPPIQVTYDRPALARERVRFVGEPVAVVLAENRYVAEDGAESVLIDIDPLPVVTDPVAAAGADAPKLFDGTPNVVLELVAGTPKDEVAVIFDRAAHVVKVELNQDRLAPTPMEARAILIMPVEDGLTIFCSHQAPQRLRDAIAGSFGLDRSNVRVIVPNSGGAFGQKSHTFPEYMVLAHLALRLGRPVRWVEDRRESFIASSHGRGQTQRIRLAADHDGRLLALEAALDADIGAYPHTGALIPLFSLGVMSGPYLIPAVSVTARSIVTNTCPTAPYRGAGRPEAAYGVERAMSLLAHRLDVDPAELRMRNLISEDAYPYASPVGTLYDSGNTAALLTKALQLADWEGLRKRQASEKEKLIGIGVCTYVERSGGQDGTTEFAEVEVLRDGKVVVRSGSVSTGQDHRTPLAKIAADELGIEPANVTLLQGDTAFVVRGTGTFASRSMQVGGAAVKDTCVLLLEEARSRAADHLEVAEADLTYEDGSFTVVGAPEKNVGLAELAADSPLIADHDAVTKQAFPTGAYIAVVEIDRETGEVSLDKLVAVDDCGTIIDPVGTRGQVIGSIAQGVGQSLYEVFVYDDDGQPLTSSMMDYLLPTVSEMVAPTLAHLESPSPFSSVGAKGAGEAGCIGVPPAIANAVEDALGRVVERLDPPFTPEKVWSLLTATRA